MLRWIHTARHVPPDQLAAWAFRRLRRGGRVVVESDGSAELSDGWAATARRMLRLDEGAGDLDRAERLLARRFRFVGRELHLPAPDWGAAYVSPLWTYHLHYFDFALDLARAGRATGDPRFADACVALWTDWIDDASRGDASIEPYPTSVRCMNALRTTWLLHGELPPSFESRLLSATHAQLAWLSGHLERDLGANHLQRNLAALAWGSLVFGGGTAAGWRRHLLELWDDMPAQVLPDGGHAERSPMYHAASLEDYLRTVALCRAAGAVVPDEVPARLLAMTRALMCLSRPDGSLHLFNDAVDGERPTRSRVVALAREVLDATFEEPSGHFALSSAGYFGHVGEGGAHRIVVDAGSPGPAHQPGHAHCGMLSFELDFSGRRLVVDSGLHGYDGDPYREYVRSTRAHNTVSVDGRDQHEMWGTFRVARRGEVLAAASPDVGRDRFEFRGSCRPYHDRRAVHSRLVAFDGGELSVRDRVEGAAGRPLTSWLHLHPSVRLERSGPDLMAFAGAAAAPHARIRVSGADEIVIREGERDPAQGWYCPEFGVALPASVVELHIHANDGRDFGWRIGPP